MSVAKSAEILPPTSANAFFSGSVSSPRQRPRAQSGSPTRPVANADGLPNSNVQLSANANLPSKQQHHVAFRDEYIDKGSPNRRMSAASAYSTARPAYFSQVTLQPVILAGDSTSKLADKVLLNDVTYRHQLTAAQAPKETMPPSATENIANQPSRVTGLSSQHSVDVADAPGFASLFSPLYQVGNASVQLQRSIDLYQAKLKKARRRLEEEQVEREKALNAYLRYAVNAASADERAKRKDEFQRRNAKYSSNILHLERKIVEYKAKIDHFSTRLAASTGSSNTSGDSQPASAAALTSSIDADTNDATQLQTQLQQNKWKSATLPPGFVPPYASKSKSTGAGSVIRKAVNAPVAAIAQHLTGNAHRAHLHSASSANLSRLETSALQQQDQLPNTILPTKRVSSTSTSATLESGDSSTEPSSLQPLLGAQSTTLQSRLRDGKLALSLRDSQSSTTTTNNIIGGFSLRGRSKDDSALAGLAPRLQQRQPLTVGSTSGGEKYPTRTSGSTRWYHAGLVGESSKDQSYISADINQPGLLDDEQVSVSSIGTGSRGGASGGDNSSDNVLRQRFDQLIHEMSDIRTRLEEWNITAEMIREQSDNQFAKLSQALDEHAYKSSALERQLADVAELRRADADSWRHAVEEMEERISYQIQERLRDMQENVDRLDTRFALMEHTQAREKALLSLESIQNSTTQQMLFKLLNLVLAVLQFIIVLGSSVAAMIAPVFDSKLSFFVATLVVAMAFVVANSVDSMSDLLNPAKFVKACVQFMLSYGSNGERQGGATSKTADFVINEGKKLPLA